MTIYFKIIPNKAQFKKKKFAEKNSFSILTHPFCNELFGPNSGQLFKKFIKAQKIFKIKKKHTYIKTMVS